MPSTANTLPLAFSQSRFTKEIAHKCSNLLSDEAKKALALDYTNSKDRDDAMWTVTMSLAQATKKVGEEQTSESGYSKEVLDFYDNFVYEWNVPYLWRQDVNEIKDLYRTCVGPSKKHCEFAVGTGLMLEVVLQEGYLNLKGDDVDKLTLIDLQPATLDKAEQRLRDVTGADLTLDMKVYDVVSGKETVNEVQQDLQPEYYNSVAAMFLLHCLHETDDGDVLEKAVGNISKFVHPTEGVFFGGTVLGKDVLDDDAACMASKNTIEMFCKFGVFDNKNHSFERVEKALKSHFNEVEVWQSGHDALWKAYKPKSS